MKVSLIQYSAGIDIAENFNKAIGFLKLAIESKPDIICLPENFLHSGPDSRPNHTTINCAEIKSFRKFAKENKVNLILGSIKIRETGAGKSTNTCLVIDRNGEIVHRYDKIFMYTINKDGVVYDEASETKSGEHLGLFELDGIKIGVGICVDIRFPFYFSELARKGAKVIFLPSVMRKLTGKKLWEYLPVARAIENQVYFCACSQTKNIGNSKTGDAVGNSKIISFNGNLLSQLGEEEGICTAALDFESQNKFRSEILMLGQFNKKFD